MKIQILLITGILSLSVNAHADRLFTPTLWAVQPDALACNLTNVSRRTRTVRVRIITNGKVLLESERFRLSPRHTADHFVEGLQDGGPIYCEFTVEGDKKHFRGAAKLFHFPNSSDFVSISAE